MSTELPDPSDFSFLADALIKTLQQQSEMEARLQAMQVKVVDSLVKHQQATEKRLLKSMASIRAAIMERTDRLQNRIDGHADDLQVNLAAAQLGGKIAREVRTEMRESQLTAAREQADMAALLDAMQRQINRLQAEIQELRGGQTP